MHGIPNPGEILRKKSPNFLFVLTLGRSSISCDDWTLKKTNEISFKRRELRGFYFKVWGEVSNIEDVHDDDDDDVGDDDDDVDDDDDDGDVGGVAI